MNILVYFDSLLVGDSMMFLPALKALRMAEPKAYITLMCGRGKAFLAGAGRAFGEAVADELIDNPHPGGAHPTPSQPQLIGQLAGRHFDLIIDTQGRFMTTLTLRSLRPNRLAARSKGVLLSRPFYLPPFGGSGNRYGERLLDLCARGLGRPLQPVLEWPIPENYRQRVSHLLANEVHRPLLGIAPGASVPEKRWPIEKYSALAKRQLAKERALVFILGPAETDLRAQLLRDFPEACIPDGGDDPWLTLAIAERMTVTLSNDGGAGHLLAATSPRHISRCARADPARWAPWAHQLRMLTPALAGVAHIHDIDIDAVERLVDGFF